MPPSCTIEIGDSVTGDTVQPAFDIFDISETVCLPMNPMKDILQDIFSVGGYRQAPFEEPKKVFAKPAPQALCR